MSSRGAGRRGDLPLLKMKIMEPSVYILTNTNRTVLYTGVTSDVWKRVLEHRNGTGSQFTRRYRLHRLVFVERHSSMLVAIAREKQIKSWSRARKVALINDVNPAWRDLMPVDD